MNFYLAFDHTSVENGKTYYYFRAGLFHGGTLPDLLLLASDLDIVELLSLPTTIPTTLASGEQTQSLSGGSYTVPVNLYLLYVANHNGFSPVNTPLIDVLNNGVSNQPIVVYAEEPVGTSPYPAGYSPITDKIPNVSGQPGWYVPSLATKNFTIASKKSSFPFWTQANFNLFEAYGSGEYTCEGLPYNIHVTCNPGEMTIWNQPVDYRDVGFWQVDGYYRAITSNESTWLGAFLQYDSGTISSLSVDLYAPPSLDDPILFFNLPEPVVYEPSSPIINLLLVAINLAALANTSIVGGGWKFAESSRMSAGPPLLVERPFGINNVPMGINNQPAGVEQ